MVQVELAREAEVRMTCSLDGRTYLAVNEPSKCKYVVLLRTPKLCTALASKPNFRDLEPELQPERQEL